REKFKMADESKIWVEKQQTVLKIHQKLKKEISNIANAKSWDNEKKKDFEKSLFELYKDAIEESVKRNVSVNGKDWVDEPAQAAHETTSCQEQMEPLNVERKREVNDMWSALEELLRETTKKRKEYPPLITEAVKNVLQYKVQIVDAYNPSLKTDAIQSTAVNIAEDVECNQRLKQAIEDLTEISKAFPELQSKLDNLGQALATHKAMESSEVDAVLFSKNKTSTPVSRWRSSRVSRTPIRYVSPMKTNQAGKRSIKDRLSRSSSSHSYKKK
ncbi:uncharacterized protein LOC116296980, partial [Actinia tenebrosa]|uniref:Uncharacterized protein LOC116296980 n=1 Tax=Actinia tenebrosa TaxID=6105 RepID=A0A6P8I7E0_ACTTE